MKVSWKNIEKIKGDKEGEKITYCMYHHYLKRVVLVLSY
tara:strand:+ start:299 stop:415 length:117 start_codon:yes stop_codon:yes gene_type:complete